MCTKMPKANKSSAREEAQVSTQQEANETSQEELPSSDQESDSEVTFNPSRQQPPSGTKHVHAIYRRSKDGLDSE